jgi:hypothetical protein
MVVYVHSSITNLRSNERAVQSKRLSTMQTDPSLFLLEPVTGGKLQSAAAFWDDWQFLFDE